MAILVLAMLAIIPSSRHRILRAAGWWLVAEDPLERVDVVIVAVDAGDAGVLEAADLVHQGVASRVAVLAEPATAAQREFARRGVGYLDAAAVSARQLSLLGVSSTERIPSPVDGTESEARVLRDWCTRRQIASAILVSNADHSRRVRRVLKRSLRGCPIAVLVRSARHSDFNPDSWWLTRTGVRTEIVESEKLLLDLARHPVS